MQHHERMSPGGQVSDGHQYTTSDADGNVVSGTLEHVREAIRVRNEVLAARGAAVPPDAAAQRETAPTAEPKRRGKR